MTTHNAEWKEASDQVFIGTYARYPITMVRGEGCRLWDADGREYLDFLAGIAVVGLGHCHPAVTEAIRRQAGELVHVSNLYYTVPQTELAELLVANTFAERVFMANSGAEANEAAIKLARIASDPGKFRIISLHGSFHGRTLATVAATGQSRFHKGFEPMPDGFDHVPAGDLAAVEAAITDATCAILCEPVQGESGVLPLGRKYLQGLRQLCDRHGLLLIFDEVQTGIGRTGSLFAYQQLGVVPDIMTSAKGLGNGLPIGAMLTTARLAAKLGAGSHASTFGGNPVASAAGVATLKVLLADGFLAELKRKGDFFKERLQGLADRFPTLATEARGLGLMLGLVLTPRGVELGGEIVNRMLARGCIINFAGNTALRFVPPLVVGGEEIDQLLHHLAETLTELSG
ncbi:MAG: aspartate aminotransferase family protein [Desulfopila sp.]